MWESGAHRPTAKSIQRVADVLGVDDAKRASLMRCAFVQDSRRRSKRPRRKSARASRCLVWSESRRASHFATVSLRVRGRCRLSNYRLSLGWTGAELARRCGVANVDVCALETGNESPRRAALYAGDDPWRETSRRIAEYLGVTCEWLWPEHAPATPRLMREETPTPEALYADAETRERVRAAVASLPPRERAVIVRRFGLIDGEEATLEEIAPHVGGVSRERVRQLEAQALRQLRAILRNDRGDAA